MSKKTLTDAQIKEIVDLRKTGHSLTEIKKITGRANGSVFKYIKGVKVLSEYKEILKSKQGGSKERAKNNWIEAKNTSNKLIGDISNRDKLIFLAGLYWGEGSKNEFNLINGDPYLIRSFVDGLYCLGVNKEDIKYNFRIYSHMDKGEIVNFWINFLKIDKIQIGNQEIVKGNGENKLKYGMCRVRVRKSQKYFKLVMSMIDLIKTQSMPL